MPFPVVAPPEDAFGAIVGRDQVAQAVAGMLSQWLPVYIAEIERQRGLMPRTLPLPPNADITALDTSYQIGVDLETWTLAETPVIIVVTQPTGTPTRFDLGFYGCWYESQIAVIVQAEDEQSAIQQADWYGAAVMACALQQGSLGGVVSKTLLVEPARTEFVNPAVRNVARAVVTVHHWVGNIVDESRGPLSPPSDPYLPVAGLPVAETVTPTVVAVPVTEQP